ncbi:GNAT family N-acetyltransferase [Allochromatium vinosum]|uniref:GNAT family N-acetyltransferase n=1 Tax=Allochromatium vinosum TaxID=1049 RepID=UPI001905E925|nr:GNAT family N-acetyltransferase [Allochromatium vinosum]MBK1654991.1 hypothetical protein [Allochromatium vinosum]
MTTPTTATEKPNVAPAEDAPGYAIRVIEDIQDPDLVHHWKRIEEEADVFPQMYYEWCEPWWRLRSGKRKLHVVAVEDSEGKIVGIAPLCIEKRFGLRVLRSFPIHFGDFYFFLCEHDGQDTAAVAEIVGYLKTFARWDFVHLANVNNQSAIYSPLADSGFQPKALTNVLTAEFPDASFDHYLKTLSKNSREQFRRKLRRLQEQGEVKCEWISDATGYVSHANIMRSLYNNRWADDHSLPPDDEYYECRNAAVRALFEKRKMALFLLYLDKSVLAFRLGFLQDGTFYEWKLSHDPRLARYSPGMLANGKVIEELIARNYRRLNFMAGDYSYKRSWATDGAESTNYEFFSCGASLRGRAYLQYRLHWRDKLRAGYHALLEIRWVRAVKRWLEAQRRRFQT